MALDIKIEIYACSLFRKIWLEMDKVKTNRDIRDFYGNELDKTENINEVLDELYIKPVICHRELFQKKYLRDAIGENEKYLNSPSQCCNYITDVCNAIHFHNSAETIFDRIFATCAFVSDFCIRIQKYDIVEYGHMFWAKHFDKFTNVFYESGGWLALKASAEKYNHVYTIFSLFKSSFSEIVVAIENYFVFIADKEYQELRDKRDEKTHISKLWIKFRIDKFKDYISTTSIDEDDYTAEFVLVSLQELFDDFLNEKTGFNDSELSKISTDNLENETNVIDNVGIEDSPEEKYKTSNTSEL